MGVSGKEQPGGVRKWSFPRSDLQVTVDGVPIKPALALGGWVAFAPMGNAVMAMGDLVLTEDEIAPVMTKLQQGGIEQTALHNHLLRETPRVMYLHVQGHGDPVTLAESIHAALALTKTPLGAASSGTPTPLAGIDTNQLDQVIGTKGSASGGVYQFSLPRAEKITDEGMEVPPSLGTAIALNFQPTGDGKAAITGDFVLIPSEVNPVLRALQANHIEVTAIHSHTLDDQPHLIFLHFWAHDDATRLAHGLRAALDGVNLARSGG